MVELRVIMSLRSMQNTYMYMIVLDDLVLKKQRVRLTFTRNGAHVPARIWFCNGGEQAHSVLSGHASSVYYN